MTDDRRPTDWDDDRLAAAFQARASARATPHDFTDAAIDVVRRHPTSGGGVSRMAVLGGLAAAAAIAAVAVVVAFPRGDNGNGDGPSTFGLPILSVSQAVAIRDGGNNGEEIAVSGFYTSGGVVPCPMPVARQENPTRVTCPATLNWIMEQPEKLLTVTGESTIWHVPSGPAIQPGLSVVSEKGLSSGPGDVVRVLMIGHFDDRRARLCAAEEQSACADTFLVDRIQEIGGAILPTQTVAERRPILDPSAVDAAMASVDPRLAILSRRIVDSDHLVDSEPLLATARFSHFTQFDEPLVWVLTAIVPSADGSPVQPRTFVVPDGSSIPRIGEITADSVERIELVASGNPTPTATPIPTEPLNRPSPEVIFPTEVLGLQTIAVPEAIARRDQLADDTELAVRSYWYRVPIVSACVPRPVPPPVLLSGCNDQSLWLTAAPAPLLGPPPDGIYDMPPADPSIQPLLRESVNWGTAGREPLTGDPVVVVGHYHDRRARACPDASRSACENQFIVDAVLDPANPQLGPEVLDSPGFKPVASPSEIRQLMTWTTDRDGALLLSAYPTSGESVPGVEPMAALAPDLTSAPIVWVVRYLDLQGDSRPRVQTLLVIDAAGTALNNGIYVPTADDLLRQVIIID